MKSSRFLSLAVAMFMVLAFLSAFSLPAVAGSGVYYLDYDTDGTLLGQKEAPDSVTELTGNTVQTTIGTPDTTTWYYVREDATVDYSAGLVAEGDVHIILSNGSSLTAVAGGISAGIEVLAPNNRITIYANSADDTMGKLTAIGSSNGAGIGGFGWAGGGGTVTINGGLVTAIGDGSGAGIGGGGNQGGAGFIEVTINGGVVTATGSKGIDGGEYATGGPVTINGGTVTALSGIGQPVAINGGSVKTNNMRTPPTKTDGTPVALVKIGNQEDVQSVLINGENFNIDANHPDNDDNLYLYLPTDLMNHIVTVTTSSCTTYYSINWGGNAFDAVSIFAVTFNPNGGTVSPTTLITDANGELTTLPIPTRNGYTFDGWYTAINGGTQVTENNVFISNTEIFAQWTAINGGSSTGNAVIRSSTVSDSSNRPENQNTEISDEANNDANNETDDMISDNNLPDADVSETFETRLGGIYAVIAIVAVIALCGVGVYLLIVRPKFK